MHELNPLDMSMSQILRCRYAPYGCVWMVQYQVGEQADARERKRVHELVCVDRFHEAP
jgi:hypothetical protein